MKRNRRNKTFRAYHKILKEDEDYDYQFLLALERKKLQMMIPYFEEMEEDIVVRDLRLCVRLIDIITGDDAAYRTWRERRDGDQRFPDNTRDLEEWFNAPTEWLREPSDFPHRINVRNAKRFRKSPLPELDGTNDALSLYILNKVELRKEKASRLYNLIRMYRMRTWWY